MNIIKACFFIFFAFIFGNICIKRDQDCYLIHGGGYPAFWYYYYFLNNNKNIENYKEIYCYSTGCLSYVSQIYFDNKTIFLLANKIKQEYESYNINRYEAREKFILQISRKVNLDISKLNNLNIITSNYKGNCIIKIPNKLGDLITALNETSSIPFLTSKLDFNYNIDGFFCFINLPKCNDALLFPLNYYYIANIFNPSLRLKDII